MSTATASAGFPGRLGVTTCRVLPSCSGACRKRVSAISDLLLLALGALGWVLAAYMLVVDGLIALGGPWWLVMAPVVLLIVSSYVSALFIYRAVGGLRATRRPKDRWTYSALSALSGLVASVAALFLFVLVMVAAAPF